MHLLQSLHYIDTTLITDKGKVHTRSILVTVTYTWEYKVYCRYLENSLIFQGPDISFLDIQGFAILGPSGNFTHDILYKDISIHLQ